MNETPWIKASASGESNQCVEVRSIGDRIEVRDSKLGDRSDVLSLTSSEFAAWMDGAKGGEFDHLM